MDRRRASILLACTLASLAIAARPGLAAPALVAPAHSTPPTEANAEAAAKNRKQFYFQDALNAHDERRTVHRDSSFRIELSVVGAVQAKPGEPAAAVGGGYLGVYARLGQPSRGGWAALGVGASLVGIESMETTSMGTAENSAASIGPAIEVGFLTSEGGVYGRARPSLWHGRDGSSFNMEVAIGYGSLDGDEEHRYGLGVELVGSRFDDTTIFGMHLTAAVW